MKWHHVATAVVAVAALGAGAAYEAGLLTPAPKAVQVDVYSWKDADGVTHFNQSAGEGQRVTVDTARITRLKTEHNWRSPLTAGAQSMTAGEGTADDGQPARPVSVMAQLAGHTVHSSATAGAQPTTAGQEGADARKASPQAVETLEQKMTDRAINQATQ